MLFRSGSITRGEFSLSFVYFYFGNGTLFRPRLYPRSDNARRWPRSPGAAAAPDSVRRGRGHKVSSLSRPFLLTSTHPSAFLGIMVQAMEHSFPALLSRALAICASLIQGLCFSCISNCLLCVFLACLKTNGPCCRVGNLRTTRPRGRLGSRGYLSG